MDVYIYQADIYCSDCARGIQYDIRESCARDYTTPDFEDSDNWPQGPYPDGGGEADCPQHCGACQVFLENPLTGDGYKYARELLAEHYENGRGGFEVLIQWRDFYDLAEHLEDFTDAYIECALWSSTDESDPETGGDPFDMNYGSEDIAEETMEDIRRDCAAFYYRNFEVIEAAECNRGTGEYSKWAQAGHDFWLTRVGHGAGFWDGDWSDPAGDLLTDASKAFGEVWLYLGDDQRIYHG